MADYRCPYCARVIKGGQRMLAPHLRVCAEWPKRITEFLYDIASVQQNDITELKTRVAQLEAQVKGQDNAGENAPAS